MKNQSWKILVAVLFCLSCVVLADGDWLKTRFGKDLKDANGNPVSLESLKGKMIGLYFSAHWCPPCRNFTPKLVQFRNDNKKKFEVVFISSDKDADAMKGYMEEMKMKWAALPWRGEKANALSAEFDVKGIPTLIVLDKNGKVLTTTGRREVETAPKDALKLWKKAGKQKDTKFVRFLDSDDPTQWKKAGK